MMTKDPDYMPIEMRVVGHMIAELEKLGYKVTPAHNEALTYHRASMDEKSLMNRRLHFVGKRCT